MWWLIGSYLVLVFVLPVALSALVGYRSLPRGLGCPRCGDSTVQLLSPALRRVSRVLPSVLQRRWCLCCGWEGGVRVPRRQLSHAGRAPAPRPGSAAPRPHGSGRDGVEPVRPTTLTVDVRSVEVDGAPWRVLLQCWTTTGRVHGRFVFVAPSGRLLLDSKETFSGTTRHEVLGQARALPDRQLATRLRRLVSG